MGFIIACVFIGLVLAFILAPIVMMAARKHLKEMDLLIAEFESKTFNSSEEKEAAKSELKKKLIAIKGKISTADKASMIKAADKISIL